jgi:integrase
MSDSHSSRPAPPSKPARPYPDFPLFPHAAGVWAKKIRGKLYYFGPWTDPDAALANYLKQKEDLHAGRTPRPDTAALTVKDVANAFLNAKQASVNARELSQRSWDDYKEASDLLVGHMGKGRLVSDLSQDVFASLRTKMVKRWGPHRLKKFVQIVRSVFKYAFDADMIERPVRFGPGFKRPTNEVLRRHCTARGPKLFTAEEVRRLLDAARPQIRAMALLGINCGFGNADVGTLPLTALDLDGGRVNYPRPKTGIDRRCPLWPETVAAVREALASRPRPKSVEYGGLVFLTAKGGCWHTGTTENPLSHEMGKLLKGLGISGRGGLNFYGLRHTFRTIANEVKDQPAIDHVMGHARDDMASVYRERISDERLKAVTDHVRRWLFGETPPPSADR